MTDQSTTKPASAQATQNQLSTGALAKATAPLPLPSDVPDIISYETALNHRSAEIALIAFHAVITGAHESKTCNTMLGSARVLQNAARLNLAHRLIASKLTMQESKLITTSEQDQVPQQQGAQSTH